MTNRLQQNYPQFFELNGTALNDGYVYIGIDGLNPETNPISVFLDATLSTPISQPLRTTGGYIYYNGSPVSIYFGNSNYSITVKNSLNTLIYTNLSAYTMPFVNTAMVVENIEELKTFNIQQSNQIETLGYYEKGDGGGGLFYWDLTSTEADNGGTVIQATGIITGRWKRVFSGAVNVKWFGAKGDNTNNDTPSFNLCLAFCRTNNVSMYIPDGNYVLLSATSIGTAVSIIGESESSTILKPNFSITGYVFEFNATNVVSKNMGNFSIIGITQYDAITKGIKADPAYVMRLYNLTIHNVTNALYLNDSWGTSLKNIRIMYSIDPITMNIPNGSSIKDVYIQRFKGAGVRLVSGLGTSADNLILEYGVDSAVGLSIQAMQSFKLSNFYTEGDMGTDILITFKNQKACVNTKIENCWFNSQATKIISAVSCRGLEIDNVVMQTPNAISLIDLTGRTYSDGSVIVGNVVQVDQNANSFIGDVRGTGQTLIPLSTNNIYVYLKTPHPSHGNYTDADLTNIANYTVKDSGGIYPCYDKNIILQNDIASFNASYTGYFVYRTMKIANVYSQEPTTVNFRFSAIATETVGDCTYNIKLTNSTNGYIYETSFDVAGKTTGQLVQATARLVLEKGSNTVTFQIQRKANDGGTTTLSASAYQFEKLI